MPNLLYRKLMFTGKRKCENITFFRLQSFPPAQTPFHPISTYRTSYPPLAHFVNMIIILVFTKLRDAHSPEGHSRRIDDFLKMSNGGKYLKNNE